MAFAKPFLLLLFTGVCAIIEAVKAIRYDEPQTTYNFEVADFHTYYVGTGVLVHNIGCGQIQTVVEDAKEFLGEDATVITNKYGDKIFLSKDGNRKLRFDISNPSPHNNPHAHVEIKTGNKWKKSGPIWPIDVTHN